MNDLDENLIQWSKQFEQYKLPRYEQLPSIDYYIDQVTEYINSYMHIFCDDFSGNLLTNAMINNYVKLRLIPPPVKKKYNKIHISNLITITIIKQVCVIAQIKEEFLSVDSDNENAYNLFCDHLENSLLSIPTIINNNQVQTQYTFDNIALKSICMALTNKILAIKFIQNKNIQKDL